MLKRLYCLCEIDLELETKDPILVKSGYESLEGTKMAFITTNRNGNPEPYLPGSSLKGVFRSHFEKMCRTLKPDNCPVCLPYRQYRVGRTEVSCGAMFQKKRDDDKLSPDNADVYRHSCPACRMFGSTYFIGRLSSADAYLTAAKTPEIRPGVSIDRHSCGAVPGGLFDYEALVGAKFTTTIALRNFELWMLGALGYLLWDLQDEVIRIGAHKSRGMGRVQGTVRQMRLSYYANPNGKVLGLSDFVTPEEINSYGMHHVGENRFDLPGNGDMHGLRRVYDVTANAINVANGQSIRPDGLFAQLAPLFNYYIKKIDWEQNIVAFTEGEN